MKLEKDEQIEVVVNPAERYQVTNLEVCVGEQYHFEAHGKWKDASHICGPEGWQNWWSSNFLRFSRLPNNDLFFLGGNIGRDEKTNFPIGSSGTRNIEATGCLYLFANDLWYFYFNNYNLPPDQGGPMTVAIRRVV
ncbi:hypothetical protein [Candidatus Methylobacter oryzae]|uniref:Uncharacterized protein n=1 Tax=Candidatus Methylobacter oryzae TaxID=2497749 RepID=A0ABY3C8S4_9GAMM|nr:hypothetical protein [Candidatus Methylobacter oryzae]TRW92669.1 hypothetical protein EKO24_014665 [Candidatus Methylobacter oryzae]